MEKILNLHLLRKIFVSLFATLFISSSIFASSELKSNATNQGNENRDNVTHLSAPTNRPAYLKSMSQSTEKTLVILVRFPDTDLSVFAKTTQDYWNNLFFGSKPSIKDYFSTNSYGKLDLIPAEESNTPQNNGVAGWYILSHPLNWYKTTYSKNDEYYGQIAKDAIIESDTDVDYSLFDYNYDGYISAHELHIYVIVACYDAIYSKSFLKQSDPALRRGHFYLFYPEGTWNIVIELDSKVIGDKEHCGGISLSSELLVRYKNIPNIPIKVGLLAHEIGHDLGLPEHYCKPDHAWIWCLMGAGDGGLSEINFQDSDYPNHICAVHKEQLGWVDPVIIQHDMSRNISQIETSGECLKLWENGNPNDEYFLIENRNKQPVDNYDSSLPASGLLIWHVDKKRTTLDRNQGVALEQADNQDENGVGNAGDVYVQGKEFLPFNSSPNSMSNPPDSDISGISVYNISQPGNIMSATVKVSHFPSMISLIPKPNYLSPDDVLNSSIKAYLLDTWMDTVESATDLISFNIKQGQDHGTLDGMNPIYAQNGQASINFHASPNPGTAIIEVSSPNLSNTVANIFICNLGNYALRFDGKDDYLEILDNSEPNQYTIEAWVKVFQIYDSNIIVRTGNSGPHSDWSHQLRIRDGRFEHYLWDGSSHELQGTTTIQEGNLYHIAGVASNNGMMRLFVNGIEEGNAQFIGTMNKGLNRYLIGSSSGRRVNQNSGINFFNGVISEIRISTNNRYDGNFTPVPIAFVANENTVGLFHFSEGSGQIVGNSVTGLSDGTLGSTSEKDNNDPVWISSNILPPPFLLSPEDNSVIIGSATFKWLKVNNANNYQLQISNDANFENIIWENNSISGDKKNYEYTGSLLIPNVDYYYRLNYVDFNDEHSEWSESRKFKILNEIQGENLINENFNSGEGNFTLNGNSTLKDNYILLVPNQKGKGGSIFYNEPFVLSTFEATFTAYFGEKKSGADGLCFIWQANSPQALGLKGSNHGGCLGYEGIENSYAIEFDTWHNGEHSDPSDNHIGFDINGSLTSVITNSNVPILEDDKWHDIRIRLENQTIYVWLDGQNYLDHEIDNYNFDKQYYFGCSAATGAVVNSHKIDNFKLSINSSTIIEQQTENDNNLMSDCEIINYPNPFNSTTTIEFSLPRKEYVTVKVYNLMGQEICILIDSKQNAGKYRILWTPENYSVSSGIYFIELKIGKLLRKMRKAIVLK